MFRAVAEGDIRRVQSLLRASPRLVRARDSLMRQPLHLAIDVGNQAMARLLIACGAPLDREDGEGRLPLQIALSRGDSTIALLLVRRGSPVDGAFDDGSFLHAAIRLHCRQLIRAMVSGGADIDVLDADGHSPLTLAAELGDIWAAKYLLTHGADCKGGDGSRAGPVHLAAWSGSTEIIGLLVRCGVAINEPSYSYGTPLAFAAHAMQGRAVRQLLQLGGKPGIAGSGGLTPLHTAADSEPEQYDSTVIPNLLAAGARIDQADGDGRTALHIAAARGNGRLVQQLLVLHADVAARDSRGATPLHLAARAGRTDVVGRLLAAGSNVNARSNDGTTPLFDAAVGADSEVIATLIASGADVNAVSNGGYTPLFEAVLNARRDIVQELISRGGRPDIVALDGSTLLHTAAMKYAGPTDTVLVADLIKTGAAIDQQDREGKTALLISVEQRRPALTRFLIARGANVDVADRAGRTPLLAAIMSDDSTTAEYLLRHGANVQAVDSSGGTVLHVAVMHALHLVGWLLDHGADARAADRTGRTSLQLLNDGAGATGNSKWNAEDYKRAVEALKRALAQ